jgi:flavin reductase (DIM6/NTAB) family NADH-FMN oxidoreductase RutF
MDIDTVDTFLSTLDYPMLIVTAKAAGERGGCLVGFSTQTSIHPPRLLVCLSKENHTTRLAAHAKHLAVHQLAPDQVDLAHRFGEHTGDVEDKFRGCAVQDGPHGLPILTECPAHLIGRVLERLDLGDHVGMLLEPTSVHRDRDSALLMFQALPGLRPGHPA